MLLTEILSLYLYHERWLLPTGKKSLDDYDEGPQFDAVRSSRIEQNGIKESKKCFKAAKLAQIFMVVVVESVVVLVLVEVPVYSLR